MNNRQQWEYSSTNSVLRYHNCNGMPNNVRLYLIYLPAEIEWYIQIMAHDKDVKITVTAPHIKYCLYCGEELNRSFNG